MANGDLRNAFYKLCQQLRDIRYPQPVNVTQMNSGHFAAFTPIYRYLLLVYSPAVAAEVAQYDKQLRLLEDDDMKFVTGTYRIFRELFRHKPLLTLRQFFSRSYVESKVVMTTQLIQLVRQKRNTIESVYCPIKSPLGGSTKAVNAREDVEEEPRDVRRKGNRSSRTYNVKPEEMTETERYLYNFRLFGVPCHQTTATPRQRAAMICDTHAPPTTPTPPRSPTPPVQSSTPSSEQLVRTPSPLPPRSPSPRQSSVTSENIDAEQWSSQASSHENFQTSSGDEIEHQETATRSVSPTNMPYQNTNEQQDQPDDQEDDDLVDESPVRPQTDVNSVRQPLRHCMMPTAAFLAKTRQKVDTARGSVKPTVIQHRSSSDTSHSTLSKSVASRAAASPALMAPAHTPVASQSAAAAQAPFNTRGSQREERNTRRDDECESDEVRLVEKPRYVDDDDEWEEECGKYGGAEKSSGCETEDDRRREAFREHSKERACRIAPYLRDNHVNVEHMASARGRERFADRSEEYTSEHASDFYDQRPRVRTARDWLTERSTGCFPERFTKSLQEHFCERSQRAKESFLERARERSATGRTTQRGQERVPECSVHTSRERMLQYSEQLTGERSGERSARGLLERSPMFSVQRDKERSVDRSMMHTRERSAERMSVRTAERMSERSMERFLHSSRGPPATRVAFGSTMKNSSASLH